MVAAIALACHLGLLIWAQNAFAGPESVVAAQSQMLARDGTLYYDLNRDPYTVCAYTPLFYLLESGLLRTGLAAITAGRLLSFAALLGIVFLSRRILLVYTRDRDLAWIAALLTASTSLLENWGTVGQVDTLAVFFAIAAFYAFSGDSLVLAGVLAGAAFFTKQTMLACPAAIFVTLWLRDRKRALRWAVMLGGAVGAIALAINFATSGRFLADTIRANLNPFALEKLKPQAMVLIGAGQMILILVCGLKPGWRAARPLFLYLGFAAAVFLLTAAKIGSDTNYQIELTILLILAACVTLHALDFLPLTFAGSKRWITLLQIPLAVHLVLNFRMTKNLLLSRIGIEQEFRAEIASLRPLVSDGGRLLSADYNASERLRGSMDVEPLIYNLLVRAGVVDPEPLRREIAAGAFSTILLFEDVTHPGTATDAETSTLPATQLSEIRRRYRLAAHLDSPYPGGVFVYKPLP